MAKLEYARDLGSRGRETVRVRVPPSAPNKEEIRIAAIGKSDDQVLLIRVSGHQG